MSLIVDSHCHLDYDGINDRLPDVLAAAQAARVGFMLSICTRIRKFEPILAIAQAHPEVACTVGTHPHNAHEELDISVDEIIALARDPKVVGIGEAGLDYHYDLSPREAQMTSFRTQIEASRATGLPLIIHSREAEDDTAALLEAETARGAFPMVLHCFSSKQVLAERGVAVGAYVSFSGILTYKSAAALRETAKIVPLDRLLVETDAPYLAPDTMRGKTNEPAFVARTLQVLAEARGLSVDAMARITSDNFFRLFKKARAPASFGITAP